MDKKGVSLESMYPAVLTIILIGIIIGIGLFVLNEVGKGVAADTITVTNEAIVLGTGVSVATASDCNARLFDATDPTVINATGGETINAANYTFTTAGLLTATAGIANIGYNDSTVNITYSYTGTLRTGATDPCEVIATAETGTGGFADWIAVIVGVLAAAIVLGIVISSFGKGTSA